MLLKLNNFYRWSPLVFRVEIDKIVLSVFYTGEGIELRESK